MTKLTSQQKILISDFMKELATKLQDDFYGYCNEIDIPDDLQGREFVRFFSVSLGQIIGGSYDDEIEIFDLSDLIKKQIIDVACQYKNPKAA
jgi:hypothetical protein